MQFLPGFRRGSPILGALGIVAIYDLRGQDEVARRPDTLVEGAKWQHTAVPGLGRATMESLNTATEMRQAMVDHYRGFVGDPMKRAGFAAVLSAIAQNDGAQVFHCSEGKDRTGWLAMLLQRLVGVSETDILADFLLTNERMAASSSTLDLARGYFGDRPLDFIRPALIADTAYLEAGMTQLAKDFGDLERYLSAGLGLSDHELDALQRLLVERRR
ncbi:tyrosine-protein phosphatase [Rhodococcus opacus]|nr:tyrosine-protein phosphatase [Rhodococcus opacus]